MRPSHSSRSRPGRLFAALGGLGTALVLYTLAPPVQAEGIVDVLVRSNEMRLGMRQPAEPDSARAASVRASWERLGGLLAGQPLPELRVVQGRYDAEAVMGRLVVASEGLADLPEGERLLVLAHELGHVVMHHWDEQCALYRRFVPGEVRPETTDPVANELGAMAHEQAHRHEFAADAFGYRMVRRLGFEGDAVFMLMMRLGAPQDTATHPGTRRRLMALRQLERELQSSGHGLAGGPDAGSEAPSEVR